MSERRKGIPERIMRLRGDPKNVVVIEQTANLAVLVLFSKALIFVSAICSRSGSHARRAVAWKPPLLSVI